MNKVIRFMSAEEILKNMYGELNHVMITGKSGAGKSELALNFSEVYGDDVIYCSFHGESGRDNVKNVGDSLKKELRITLNEVLKRKSSKGKAFAKRFLIIDEADKFTDVLAENKNFAGILEDGKDVDVYVILVSQLEISLSDIADEILDRFVRIDLSIETLIKGTYKHYKGGFYKAIGIGKHTETEESLVFYIDSKGNLWARPVEMFLETTEVDGKTVDRFERI